MDVLDVTPETFAIAADVMERLAMHAATAHRRPLADLVTAALAHQHGCGIVHHDGDFEIIAAHGGLDVELVRLELDADAESGTAHPARRQRRLRDELAVLVHQLPIPDAEMFLEDAVDRAAALVERHRRS